MVVDRGPRDCARLARADGDNCRADVFNRENNAVRRFRGSGKRDDLVCHLESWEFDHFASEGIEK